MDFLINRGVTDVFGYAGGYIVPFMDALYKRKDEITTHVCYHEQGCALAADGYARTSGKIGVYFTTSGPGAVNGLGGLADAWFDGLDAELLHRRFGRRVRLCRLGRYFV